MAKAMHCADYHAFPTCISQEHISQNTSSTVGDSLACFWDLNKEMSLFMSQSTKKSKSTSHKRYKLLPVCISMNRSKERQGWGPPTTSPRGVSCKERCELPGSNIVQIHCYCVSFSIYINTYNSCRTLEKNLWGKTLVSWVWFLATARVPVFSLFSISIS